VASREMPRTARTAASTIHSVATGPYTVRLLLPNGEEHQLEVEPEEMVLAAAFREGLDLPSMCLQGWCLTCAGRVEGPGCWDQSASRRYYEADRKAGFILLCTAHACSDLVIQTHQRRQMRDYRLAHGLPAPRG
jgi:ferredoxin